MHESRVGGERIAGEHVVATAPHPVCVCVCVVYAFGGAARVSTPVSLRVISLCRTLFTRLPGSRNGRIQPMPCTHAAVSAAAL
jgi:hypothetical protein